MASIGEMASLGEQRVAPKEMAGLSPAIMLSEV
jgi:hypothetical protein